MASGRIQRWSPSRTLTTPQNITVDGSIETLGNWFDPQGRASAGNSELPDDLHPGGPRPMGSLVGRQTWENLRSFWPERSDDATGIADYRNRATKCVVSSTVVDPTWQNSTVLSGEPFERIQALKERCGRDIVVNGSITRRDAPVEAKVFSAGITYSRYAPA